MIFRHQVCYQFLVCLSFVAQFATTPQFDAFGAQPTATGQNTFDPFGSTAPQPAQPTESGFATFGGPPQQQPPNFFDAFGSPPSSSGGIQCICSSDFDR